LSEREGLQPVEQARRPAHHSEPEEHRLREAPRRSLAWVSSTLPLARDRFVSPCGTSWSAGIAAGSTSPKR
ncbi:MAG: hypothetical protein ACO3FE_21755, partial [Planctomycetaceae bacterium]